MYNLEPTLQNSWPALFIMLTAIGVLVFLRIVVPYLIIKLQQKRPIEPTNSTASRRGSDYR